MDRGESWGQLATFLGFRHILARVIPHEKPTQASFHPPFVFLPLGPVYLLVGASALQELLGGFQAHIWVVSGEVGATLGGCWAPAATG